MDTEEIDKLFSENKDWIVTKNEGQKTKVAKDCSGVEEQDLNWIQMGETPIATVPLTNAQKYKLNQFFIRDLLNAESCGSSEFKLGDINFCRFTICGSVSKVYMHNDKYCLLVDDGTSSIVCILTDNFFLQNKQKYLDKKEELTKLYLKDKNRKLLRAALMVSQSSCHMFKSVPEIQEIKLGDIVKIFGNMKHFNDKRYVFVQNYVQVSSEYQLEFADKLLHEKQY